ncbi:hypothetical protein ACFVTY_20910 [Streptomyces sp. NPDC058067]|uniref:hypothetical protein n=1 Tax=Streptomyces sp. NPDC058067 TaxID=3346324 RepID=UPI0036DFF863
MVKQSMRAALSTAPMGLEATTTDRSSGCWTNLADIASTRPLSGARVGGVHDRKPMLRIGATYERSLNCPFLIAETKEDHLPARNTSTGP